MIYIQTADGLSQVSPSLSKEKIIEALGYTPADNVTFFEDETGALLVVDNAGYVIARIDENGLTTTQVSASAIKLNGEDLTTKLEALGNIDLSDYYTKSEVRIAIANAQPDMSSYATKEFVNEAISDLDVDVDLTGYATESFVNNAVNNIDLSNYYTKTEVDEDLTSYYTKEEIDNTLADLDVDVDLTGYALSSEVEANKVLTDAHANDVDIHVSKDDKKSWDAKSDFSGAYEDLSGAPHIVNDNEDEVVICDSQGNVILRATAEGLNVAAVYVNGKMVSFPDYSDADEGKTLKIVNGVPAWA